MTTTTSPLCSDCATNPSSHTIRRRTLCSPCLQRFVSSKVLKRMETSRPRGDKSTQASTLSKPRFLLPLSGGTSSLALLVILVSQLRRQMSKTGRTAYEITGLHVETSEVETEQVEQWWEKIKIEFPDCEFADLVSLSDAFRIDQSLLADLSLLGFQSGTEESNDAPIHNLFASARSATARSELRELLLKRTVVAMAKAHNCEAVLWGHSDTKLAATTLALVAKGRGSAGSGELADGSRLWDTEFFYPLRDLFLPELEMYLQCGSEDIQQCVLGTAQVEMPVSLKATSIDALLSTYIAGQGEKYPSIMANVVRTAGKLQAPDMTQGQACRICAGYVARETAPSGSICHGCEGLKQDIKV